MPVDLRFYDFLGEQTLDAICSSVQAEVIGDGTVTISSLAAAHEGAAGDIVFFEGKAPGAANISAASTACFVTQASVEHLPNGVIALVCERPRWSHMMAARLLFAPKDWLSEGDAPSIHETARIAETAVIGAGAAIGARTMIGPNAVIGPGVQIGHDCEIGPTSSIQFALIGNNVKLLSSVRIGETGFGILQGPNGSEDIAHWGRSIIQDYVSIGAGTCVDRGVYGDTIIGERTKIDNMVQIAHNAVVGRNCLFAGFSGVSGSSTVGDGVIMGGRVGIADHLEVGDGAILTADAGVMTNVPAGETWGGRPAKPFRQFLREVAWLQRQVKRGKKPTS